jgi:hypothetical protein
MVFDGLRGIFDRRFSRSFSIEAFLKPPSLVTERDLQRLRHSKAIGTLSEGEAKADNLSPD